MFGPMALTVLFRELTPYNCSRQGISLKSSCAGITRALRHVRLRVKGSQLHNEDLDLFDALGLEAGKDWKFWKRPSNGEVMIQLSPLVGGKVLRYLSDHPSLRETIIAHGAPV
jgi:hypothetical protein